ncbi:MAG: hypothetical protein KIT80_04445 [Chitinophagaceae bacterium]|nr:hypothetical protein [Chitinophagaceae bacterium]MCW5926140.1 hypothetical protein [Chitinophagaceae bacterium]
MKHYLWSLLLLFLAFSCGEKNSRQAGSVFTDVPYTQDYSIKYHTTDSSVAVYKSFADRNGVIKLYTSKGIMQPYAGKMLYPGTVVPDDTYRPMTKKNIAGIGIYDNQFVFIDDKAVLSNAWAGTLYSQHNLPDARIFAGGEGFAFLISNEQNLRYVKDGNTLWEKAGVTVTDIVYDDTQKRFLILSPKTVSVFKAGDNSYSELFAGDNLTCLALANSGKNLVIGTSDGYLTIDASSGQQQGDIQRKLPWTEITAVAEINGRLWFGSTRGAFSLKEDGRYNYYASRRWLPSDDVRHIAPGPEESALITTGSGLGRICFKQMTLADKAEFYEKQVRLRHIRNGFNATLVGMKDGNLGTGFMEDSDNDGLWTAMYLGGQAFRYAVTKSPEALQNCRESLDAMERLYSVNPVKGFPARSFERVGFALHNKEAWIKAPHPEWEWKSTTSSDEAIGHIFAFGVLAELVDDEPIRTKAIGLIDSLMQHIVDNDFYMIDWDGKPTLWAKWHPDYVNARPVVVGDRKINASNIVAMLQTAYHFTKKGIYKEKAFELMDKHGYLENLMRPMKEIGRAPEDADDWSKMLSEGWNHSDDEMYFLGYWGLYRYAFNDTLKEKFKEAIIDHWEIERPEKEGAWNITTALTGAKEFDLDEAVWYLQEYPLDMYSWRIINSGRKDIELIAPNFRNQSTKEVLPPDELRISRHNANRFTLDGGNEASEYSAGDIWLLPYWMGRYLGVISAAQ